MNKYILKDDICNSLYQFQSLIHLKKYLVIGFEYINFFNHHKNILECNQNRFLSHIFGSDLCMVLAYKYHQYISCHQDIHLNKSLYYIIYNFFYTKICIHSNHRKVHHLNHRSPQILKELYHLHI